jgi:hypothetical protein
VTLKRSAASHARLANPALRRTAEDRRLYALDGVGTLRLEGIAGRMATAVAGAESWPCSTVAAGAGGR